MACFEILSFTLNYAFILRCYLSVLLLYKLTKSYFMKRLILLLNLALIFFSCSKQIEWIVTDYGAIGDGVTSNTEAIQKAIDECSLAGGGTVLLTNGEFVSSTILLKDNVTLKIDKDAKLIGTEEVYTYQLVDPFVDATGQLRGKCLIGAVDVNNISIVGEGIIEGNGEKFSSKNKSLMLKKYKETNPNLEAKDSELLSNPFMVRLVRCDGITIKGVSMNQPGAWCTHLYQCNNFVIDGIKIYSHATRNNDGIDIDSSSNGEIMNCDIDSGDDAICFKATSSVATDNVHVHDCKLKSDWGTIKLGTESMGDMTNITVENCFVHDTKGGGIKVLSADGANVKNVVIRNIEMKNVEMPIFVRLCERRLTYRGAEQRPVGSIDGVTISNISAVVSPLSELRLTPPTAIVISGTPDHKIENVVIENVNIILPGGGTEADAKIVMPENITEYPEFTKLGAAPAYGLFIRNATNVDFNNVDITLEGKDARRKNIFLNVDSVNNKRLKE